jgi:hypothetical protein
MARVGLIAVHRRVVTQKRSVLWVTPTLRSGVVGIDAMKASLCRADPVTIKMAQATV